MTAKEWPALPLDAWRDTYATLHMWTQIVGKTKLALAAPLNHWWHITLHTNAHGLTTGPLPWQGFVFDIAFDFVAHPHRLRIRRSDGEGREIVLRPQSVADFYAAYLAALRDLGITIKIWPVPCELEQPVRFTEDREHASYDPDAVERWWRIIALSDEVFRAFRGQFLGKSSPSHFFWGSFDLAVTRFSGRRAPERPGADRVMREAYSHEVISAGFWPGSGAVQQPAFYAYAAPEPDGLRDAKVGPVGASYDTQMSEFILPYEAVRTAPVPAEVLRIFLQQTYVAAADLAHWDRANLERR